MVVALSTYSERLPVCGELSGKAPVHRVVPTTGRAFSKRSDARSRPRGDAGWWNTWSPWAARLVEALAWRLTKQSARVELAASARSRRLGYTSLSRLVATA